MKTSIAYIKSLPWDMVGVAAFLFFVVLPPLLLSSCAGRRGEACSDDGSDTNFSSGTDAEEEMTRSL